MRVSFALLLFTTLAAGCTSGGSADGLRERQWKLVSVRGFETIPAGVTNPTIQFAADGHLRGSTGCNNAGAAYSVGDDTLSIERIVMTERACLQPAGDELERAYVAALQSARRFRIADDHLELLDATGTVVARFR